MSETHGQSRRLSRRKLLQGAAALGVGSALAPLTRTAAAPAAARPDLIRAENDKPGTTDWLLQNTRVDPQTRCRCPWIEGYCSRTSVRAGDKLAIMVSTNPPTPFVIDIYRLGYYGGKGGRHLGQLGPFKGKVQADPDVGEERLRECRWEPCTELEIPNDWPSGVYLGKLTVEKDKLQSYVIFIVRDDRPCDFLFQCSDTTWSAYNRWPDHWALYDNGSEKRPGALNVWYNGPNVRVSFDRPYGKYCQVLDAPLSLGSGEFLLWEFPLAFWMEKQGFDISYSSNVDTHADAQGLLRTKGWLSVGHDEYWSMEMFRNVKAAVAAGVNVAFFSGNTCCYEIPFLPNSAGVPHRIISRLDRFGPRDERDEVSHPENKLFKFQNSSEGELIGARNIYPVTGAADWTCTSEKHWIFQGTGMKNGDGIPGLVGWEWHGDPAAIPGLTVVARGEAKSDRNKGIYTATIYPGPKDNWVFNAATIWWSDGLSAPPGYQHPTAYGAKPRGPDPRVQQITANLFNRFRGQGN